MDMAASITHAIIDSYIAYTIPGCRKEREIKLWLSIKIILPGAFRTLVAVGGDNISPFGIVTCIAQL